MSRWVRLKLSGTFFSEITLSKQWKASYPWKNTKNPEILVSRNPEYFKSRLYPIEDNLGLWDFYFFNFIQNFSVQFFRKSRNFRQRHDRKMKKSLQVLIQCQFRAFEKTKIDFRFKFETGSSDILIKNGQFVIDNRAIHCQNTTFLSENA